jgi:CubicO group peptidase (beta-lactamase class C family)
LAAAVTPAEHFATWPVDRAGFAVVTSDGTVESEGDRGVFELASIAKLFAALTALIALEEGTLDLDAPAGPEGATVRHLLAHASGLDFDGDRIVTAVGARRVYSNSGIERYAEHLAERTGMSYSEYLRMGVLDPLSLDDTALYGSPARACGHLCPTSLVWPRSSSLRRSCRLKPCLLLVRRCFPSCPASSRALVASIRIPSG